LSFAQQKLNGFVLPYAFRVYLLCLGVNGATRYPKANNKSYVTKTKGLDYKGKMARWNKDRRKKVRKKAGRKEGK
jgi:hypothetical protein